MCGIVGYIGGKEAKPILIDSLKRLEYRGYDSAGIALLDNESKIRVVKTKGAIKDLEPKIEKIDKIKKISSRLGISHTRWATHGKPSDENAHPFVDCHGKIAIVHNGIIENHLKLKDMLIQEGHKFTSETDTEVIVHLLERNYKGNLEEALLASLKEIKGSYAIVAMHVGEPDKLVVARNESPVVLGKGNGENLVASDVPALLKYTNKVMYLENREIAILTKDAVFVKNFEGKAITKEWHEIDWSIDDAEKSGYDHFMLKEIYEQPKAIHETMLGRLHDLNLNGILEREYDGIKIVACGTSYHAGLVGKYILEKFASIPTVVEYASENRYSELLSSKNLVILITQSGETADTLSALREAKRKGCRTLAITNIIGSSAVREADAYLLTRAGPEIGVAATKTFTTQLVALYLLGLYLGRNRGVLEPSEMQSYISALKQTPRVVQSVLDNADKIEKIAHEYKNISNAFFIGRGISYPIALEGALKLKEISYVHAEGYPAGELKHGPLALLTPEAPVFAIAVKDQTYDKMLGNIGEVSARDSPVIGVGTEGDKELEKLCDEVIFIPDIPPIFTPLPSAVVMQLIAYHIAKARGCPIDKPRHLAKSVTVE